MTRPIKVVFKPGKFTGKSDTVTTIDISEQLGESDYLLYDPVEDEQNALDHKDKSMQLSCAKCFSAIAYTNESQTNKPAANSEFECDYIVAKEDVV